MAVITLKNVRMSFPQIFTPSAYIEGQKEKYSANFLLDKDEHKDQIAMLRKEINTLIKGQWSKPPAGLQVALGDGEEKVYDGYENAMFLRCSSMGRPTVIDRDRSPIVEADEKVYAGCYVNAAISFWVQENYGGRINCNVHAVQFVKDGESFGRAAVKTEDVFEDMSVAQAADADEEDFLS